jgi:hypothetical protein
MSFKEVVEAATKYFPNLTIKYKDKSLLMKIISKVLFFNKDFNYAYTTTLGSNIYYPSESFVKIRPISSIIILLHELIHINDSNKIGTLVFSMLYMFPQILVLLFFPMLLVSWKIALLFLLFALPLPAYFRMKYEKRAYIVSMYSLTMLSKKLSFEHNLDKQKDEFVKHFKNSDYYYMWIFGNIQKEFDDAALKIKDGKYPFEDPIFQVINDLISKS